MWSPSSAFNDTTALYTLPSVRRVHPGQSAFTKGQCDLESTKLRYVRMFSKYVWKNMKVMSCHNHPNLKSKALNKQTDTSDYAMSMWGRLLKLVDHLLQIILWWILLCLLLHHLLCPLHKVVPGKFQYLVVLQVRDEHLDAPIHPYGASVGHLILCGAWGLIWFSNQWTNGRNIMV